MGSLALSASKDRQPRTFRLEGKPKLSLLRAGRLLDAMMAPDELRNLRLGGGTALAMRWGHRRSTDIDLAMNAELAGRFVGRARAELRLELGRLAAEGLVKRSFRVGRQVASWSYTDSGPVSLSAARKPLDTDGMDREEDTGIALAPTAGILEGKLIGRVIHGGKLLVRDGYDLCCMFRHEPGVAEALVLAAKESHHSELALVLEQIRASSSRIILGRPLMEAAHKDLARDPWGAFADLAAAVLTPPQPSPESAPEPPSPSNGGCGPGR